MAPQCFNDTLGLILAVATLEIGWSCLGIIGHLPAISLSRVSP